jgi:NAD+ synthase
MSMPNLNTDLAVPVLTRVLSEEIGKAGFERAVVGLSGGVDSAVSAALAARALGSGNVWAVLMPYRTSSPESMGDAKAVVAATGIHEIVEDISPQVDAYFDLHPDADRMRRGNKMARERMTVLYDHSQRIGALVVGTSNKTEMLLGYTTLYGDNASAVNPLGDLYKSQVFALARALDLPARVIEKAPSADLWSGQTDEKELGFTYAEVDPLLFAMIDQRLSRRGLLAQGFDPALVDRVAEIVRRTQYKRRLPVIAKLSHRTVDRDFRYPRDWGL